MQRASCADFGCTTFAESSAILESSDAFSLRQNRKYPRGKTGSAFRFGKTDHDQRAGFGNLIKICEQLDLIMVRAQDVSLQRVIVFTRGEPRIRIGGFMARRNDFAFLVE